MSTWMMRCLLAAYICIMAVLILEKNYAKALYWLGATLITVSLLWMK
jgi:hypothetical protein